MPAYSGLWNGIYATPYSGLASTIKLGDPGRELALAFDPRLYGRGAYGKVLEKLIGAVPGTTATKQHKRVKAGVVFDGPTQGGIVPIETYDDVNRATTAADVTSINRSFTYSSQPTYPRDASGNGGGSKLGF